jgi:hypothetical protein
MKTIPVKRTVTRDKKNALCSVVHLVINGQLCKPTNQIGFVWSPRTWTNGMTALSRKELVFEVQGQPYRMGKKSATPLVLAADEVLHPMGFSGNDYNAFIAPEPELATI